MNFRIFSISLFCSIILLSCGPSQEQIDQENADKEKRDSIEQAEKLESERLENLRIDSLNFFTHLADSLYQKHKLTKALPYLDSALKFASAGEETDLIQKRADYRFELKKYEDAEKDYTTLINGFHNQNTNYYQRAVCYQKLGKKREAVSDSKEAMNLGHEDAEKLYDKLNPEKRRIVDYVTRCCDGTTSSATGRGACSHHGGVCNWNDPVYETYREY